MSFLPKLSPYQNAFLWRALRTAMLGGFAVVLLPLLHHVFATAIHHDSAGSVFGTIVLNVLSHLDFLIAAFLLGMLGSSYWFFLRNLPKLSPDHESECSREDLVELLSSFQNPDLKTRLPSASPTTRLPFTIRRPIVRLLSEMGIVHSEPGKVIPVSEVADAFLCSLTAHLKGGNKTFLGDWKAETNSPERRSLVETLKRIERHRLGQIPNRDLPPARQMRSGLALIRGDISGTAHFLMIKNDQWDQNGAWWFIGGTEEVVDQGDLKRTVRREIQEEAKIEKADVLTIRPLTFAKDRRISKRLGVDTEFEYSVFAVQLNQDVAEVKKLFVDNPVVKLDYSGATRIHEFIWMKWDEVLQNNHLLTNTPKLVEALKSDVQPNEIPQTFSR